MDEKKEKPSRPKITPHDELRDLWKKFAAIYGKPGRTLTYEDAALKMAIDMRQARELLNWSVGEELTRVVQRGLIVILEPPKPITWNEPPNHTCEGCGKPFYFNGFKRWCSGICAEKNRLKPMKCCICGIEFFTKKSSQRCCGAKCRDEHLRRTSLERYAGKTAEEKAALMRKKAKTPEQAAEAAKREERRRARRERQRQEATA